MLKLPTLQFITHGNHLESAKKALEAGVKWVQFRCKQSESTEELLEQAWALRCMCNEYDAMLSIDDYVFLVDEAKAHGLHLGKDDMPISEARKILGNDIIIGGTAHNMQELREAVSEGADYIGLGPLRYTTTKEKLSELLGIEGYESILKQCKEENISIPIYAIGGVGVNDVEDLKRCGIYGLAVSGSILQSNCAKDVVKALIF